ncbi:MAG TPA: winged helix DNA-binding domain-containing protein [Chloroflexia bacterium]|nr:winged helix DNA-binding domain-containing protein [Chloroflexia bacterium]
MSTHTLETLTWRQIAGWRAKRHFLAERTKADDLLGVTSRLCGLHAQVASAAEISAWERMHAGEPDMVKSALWKDRTLVKTWVWRGTLHLVVADELPLYMAARSTVERHLTPGYLKYFDLTREEMESLIEAVGVALDGRCLTRDELAGEVGRITRQARLGDLLGGSWGSFLKPAAAQGYLCFGPSQGQNVTFVRPDQWLNRWSEVDPDQALDEILRRYLATYGPTKREEYATWFGAQLGRMRPAFERLANKITEVQVDGSKHWVLTSTLDDIREVSPDATVRLLPNFDPYIIGLSPQIKRHLPDGQLPRVFRTAGWISPVVLVGGEVKGVWGYVRNPKGLQITVDLFEPATPPREIVRGIEAEAEHLAGLLGRPLELHFDKITFGG